jgi:capsular exopolysaccharide synthesis family protein
VAFSLAVGTIVGLVLALGSVLIADWFDSRIRTESDVEGELHLPVLAMVPELETGKAALAVPDWRLDAEAEAYDNLVLEMRYSKDPDKKLHVLTVTSPIKGDGKSTVAMKIASVFGETAALSGSDSYTRVLIIDADMRRPSLHLKFGLPNVKGLSDILVGSATLEQCVQQTNRQRVDLLTSGTLSRNPVKLLQSARFDRLLAEARDVYTAIVLDAPALVPVADAAIAAVKSDGTLLVLSAGQSDFRTTRRALQRLERIGNAEIIGVVINRAKLQYDVLREYSEAPAGVAGEPQSIASSEKAPEVPRALGNT